MLYFHIFLIRVSAAISALVYYPQQSDGGGWDDRLYIFGWPFKKELDIGHLLTFLTLLAGFVAWLIATVKDRRKIRRDEARSGALRLLLKILRERKGPVELSVLKATFDAPDYRRFRVAYCGKDFKFKDESEFESAIYRLDFESKIDFLATDKIEFRLHEKFASDEKLNVTLPVDKNAILRVFTHALYDGKTDLWQLEPLTRAALKYDARAASTYLNEALVSDDPQAQRKATTMLGKFPPICGGSS